MENFIEKPNTSEDSLDACRREVEEIKAAEKSGELSSGHFLATTLGPEIDTAGLTEEDGEIWSKFKNKTLELKEFQEYRNRVANGETKNEDSHLLAQYIANKIINWEEWKKK